MKVYITFKNADMNEGRGPSVMDKIFLYPEHAAEYIDEQPGIQGRRQKWSFSKNNSDWYFKEFDVIDYSLIEKQKRKERLAMDAKKKLSPEEYDALIDTLRNKK